MNQCLEMDAINLPYLAQFYTRNSCKVCDKTIDAATTATEALLLHIPAKSTVIITFKALGLLYLWTTMFALPLINIKMASAVVPIRYESPNTEEPKDHVSTK